MTPTRRPLMLEAVEERCLPSGFRPTPAFHAPQPGGPDRFDFRGHDTDRGDRPGQRAGRPEGFAVRVADARLTADADLAVAIRSRVAAVVEFTPDGTAGDTIILPPAVLAAADRLPVPSPAVLARLARGPVAVSSARFVSTAVDEPPAGQAAETAPTTDRPTSGPRLAPPAESTATPAVVPVPAATLPPINEPADPSAPPPTPSQTSVTPLTVLPTDPPAAVPESAPAAPPVADLPPAVVVAQGIVAAAVPPLLPLVGVVPIDLVAVEAAAAELLAQLTAADPADGWTPAGRWGWLGAAVLAAGGLAHATRPAADRKPAAPGADSALARWESRHARR